MTFSSRGKTLASGGADNTIILWDTSTGKQHGQLRGHSDTVIGLVFAGSRRLLSSSLDGTVKVWQAPIRLLHKHSGLAIGLVISRDGRRLLSGSGWPRGDKITRLWHRDRIAQVEVGSYYG